MLEVEDPLAAYLFDSAVVAMGNTLDNALHDREKIGEGKDAEWKDKYTIEQLLDPDFHLPRPGQEERPWSVRNIKSVEDLMPKSKRPGVGQQVKSTFAGAGKAKGLPKVFADRLREKGIIVNGDNGTNVGDESN